MKLKKLEYWHAIVFKAESGLGMVLHQSKKDSDKLWRGFGKEKKNAVRKRLTVVITG